MRLWDAVALAEVARLRGHEKEVEALAWSGDGSALAMVRIWDTVVPEE